MQCRQFFIAFAATSLAIATGCAHRSPANHPLLNANLWRQTSAEYRALCLQIYNDAARFGRDWFVLPNATYGYWERVLDQEEPWTNLNL